MRPLCVSKVSSTVIVVLCILLGGCKTLKVDAFAGAEPRFEPDRFFEGPVRAWGVFETRSGHPKSRFRAELVGRREGSDLVITQDFTFQNGRTQQRIWKIRRIDERRYEAIASDVIGPAIGHAVGNAFRWNYTLQLRPGNRLSRVRMEHWMYLLGDGETMVNRVVIRKFGLILGQTTEYFQRGTGPVPAVDELPESASHRRMER